MRLVRLVAAVAVGVGAAAADEHSHVYAAGDAVTVWANTVGPRENRQETYEYFQLPYCKGAVSHDHYHETLGEALQGMELVVTGSDIRFREDKANETLCTRTLNRHDVGLFRFAVTNQYWFQMYLDDLPIGGHVGLWEPEHRKAFLYTHQHFSISYNRQQIIEVNLTMAGPVLLPEKSGSTQLTMTYSVTWHPTQARFEDRFEKYLDSDFFEHHIHWFSIVTSFVVVLFLIGLVSVIMLRTLKFDFARYDKDHELGDLDRDFGDDYGWKLVHGDVFRSPFQLSLLAAMLGTGTQLAVLSLLVTLYTIAMHLYLERSSILTVAIFAYALTSTISGYVSGSFYEQYGGKRWIRTMVITAALWPAVISGVSFFINFVAIYYSSTKAIPFGTIVAVICIWLFLIFPLTLLGSIIGRNWAGQGHFPTRVNPIPRPIPEKQWYSEPSVIIMLGGILPFASIFIEMSFVFASFWAYKIYYVYGFMMLVLIILFIITACVSIVCCYFLLNSEDHRWHWVCFLTGGSIAVYIYLYAVYYFFARTKMYGFFQTSFYFGYTAVLCFGIMLMCGAVGFSAANRFVRRIYATVKID